MLPLLQLDSVDSHDLREAIAVSSSKADHRQERAEVCMLAAPLVVYRHSRSLSVLQQRLRVLVLFDRENTSSGCLAIVLTTRCGSC